MKKNQNQQQSMVLAELAGDASRFYDRPLTLGNLLDEKTGNVSVTLTLSEAGVAQISAAALDYTTITTYYDAGVIKIQGQAHEVKALLDSLMIQIPTGYTKPVGLNVVVGAGDAIEEVKILFVYDDEGDRYVVLPNTGSSGRHQTEEDRKSVV